ncbi:hypothetical protein HPULCUR_003820 [Helicostylum pulchrum]|uniref:Uncharacterized protein n=1 Tax=Helicostylum pulchrum TaxID=562976 RepID=A0ABP9XUF5_9FUNG
MSPQRLYALWSGRYIKRLVELREDLPIQKLQFDEDIWNPLYEQLLQLRKLLDISELSSLRILTRNIEDSRESILSTFDESDIGQSSESPNIASPVSTYPPTDNTFDYDDLDTISIFLCSLYYKKVTYNSKIAILLYRRGY